MTPGARLIRTVPWEAGIVAEEDRCDEEHLVALDCQTLATGFRATVGAGRLRGSCTGGRIQ